MALVDVAMQGLGLGRRLSGQLYTADVQRLLYAKAALSLALSAVDKLPRSYNTAPRPVRVSLGTAWEEIAAAVVREYAYVCLSATSSRHKQLPSAGVFWKQTVSG